MSRKMNELGIPDDELEELKRLKEQDEEREAEEEFRALARKQRRYEIARDCMAAMLVVGNSDDELIDMREAVGLPEGADQGRILAENAVLYADELLARLEKE